MSETMARDLRTDRIRALGPEFGAVYHALWNEVIQLRWEWKEYRALFVDERVDLLNEHAPEFFWLVQHVLADHVIATIANLTDKPETARQPNLTVRRLPALAAPLDAPLAADLEALVAKGESSWLAIRDVRHKRLAHLDLDVALDRRAIPLSTVRVTDIDASLAALTDVIDRVQRWCSPRSQSVYDIIGRGGDASAVRHVLEIASRYEQQRMERIRKGRTIREDLG